MKKILALALCALLMMGCLTAFAETSTDAYPTKNVNVIVCYGAGGNTDMSVRALLNTATNVDGAYTFVVDNKTGNGGLIGMEAMSESDPDGYTLGSIAVDHFGRQPKKHEILR